MWDKFFIYLRLNISSKNYIFFSHNLGSFDGLFLYKNLLKHTVNIELNNCMIDKNNRFIKINAKLGDGKYLFKDSLRIFWCYITRIM